MIIYIDASVAGAFITEDPEEIYAKNNISIETMFSNTNLEALMPNDIRDPSRIEDLNENFNLILPFHGINHPNHSAVCFNDNPSWRVTISDV